MNATSRRAKAIFVDLIRDVAPSAWDDRLKQACEGDDELRRRVAELLSAHQRTGSFLDEPAVAVEIAVDQEPEQPGTLIGPYTLLESIGEGGMGVVYMAEQATPIQRRVALKVIKPGMDSRQVITRFEAERQALALMDHPNIARVIDGGTTPQGRPYFVMELVRGVPITDYGDLHRLSIAERLELFVLVCRAVQHAHQKGIIHRDIKPSNVLVTEIDGAAVPKVIDFGVAKAIGDPLTGHSCVTGFHQILGTPLYMSPEQAAVSGVDVDTRSDIYSLGVLLYELLTGTTPFDAETLRQAAFDEMRRILREEEPPRPSTRLGSLGDLRTTLSDNRKTDARRLDRTVRGELDWVVMKALEKDRDRRYQTANDLAADLMNYLTDRPVEARPPSTWYRFTKYARRNRVAIMTVVLVALALVGGIVASTWQAARARNAERAALSLSRLALAAEAKVTQERDQARTERQRADARFRLALQVVQRLYGIHGSLRGSTQRAVRDDLIRFYLQLVEDNEDDPAVTYEVGDAYLWLSTLYQPSDPERRDWAFFKALAVYERRARERPGDPGILLALAWQYIRLANRYLVEEPERREATYQRALELFEQIARTHPSRVGDWTDMYLLANTYGRMLRSEGRQAEAEALDRRVLSWYERPEVNPKWFDASQWLYLGVVLDRTGDGRGADDAFRRVIELAGENAGILNNLAWGLVSQPAFGNVRPTWPFQMAERAVELDPKSASAWNTLGVARYRAGDWAGAIEAIERSETLAPEVHTASNGFFIAMSHWQLCQKDKARTWFDRAVAGMDQNPRHYGQLSRFRAEAEELMGIKAKQE